ncbi:type II secretion system F family protein [Pseudomonas sp. MYb185]|uniref:type II secretion system F family protein n=1 Tax=Pseudomonas sp. MYb185 TaxID=1848729 RepID=UPI000CFACF5C|nr:type II secretion system F family protein [Pseudomonas sp. MYb185]PRB83820.1 type II secretion system protein F [Pseudomonas sp. MYb185]
MNPLLLSALLLLLAGGLMLYSVIREQLVARRMMARLGGGRAGSALQHLGERSGAERLGKSDPETVILLNQLGWRSSQRRTLFFIMQITVPLLLTLAVLFIQLNMDEPPAMPWLAPFFAFAVGYLVPKRVLAARVARRQEQLAQEVSLMIPMLRMLFDVGMTVEQALRVLASDGQRILPQMSRELRQVLARVDAGLELGRELRDVAVLMQVDDMTDCFAILEQLVYQGGGAMASLLSLKELLDDRRMTTLQERVSKMSAKMSVVMMLFLFPALLIVLAGPGFVAIIQALGDMG